MPILRICVFSLRTRQDGTEEHRQLGFGDKAGGCEVAGRDAAAIEGDNLVFAHHLAINDNGLLRRRLVVFVDKLELLAENAALLVDRLDGDDQTVPPVAVGCRAIARKAQ